MSAVGGCPLFPSHDFLYLASQSPRRRELLAQIGVRYELLLPKEGDDTEGLEAVWEHEPPKDYVQRVTLAKLGAAFVRHAELQLPQAPILCSDTTVALGNMILGKPQSAEHACEMLGMLQNGKHHVYSAVVVAMPQTKELIPYLRLSVSEVTMLPMTAHDIEGYVASGECMGKAGAYAIQGRMAAYIGHIAGSYSGIMGLPLCETAQLLKQFRIL
ncbi:MAG: Maf family protein [Saezia sp.]